jgi:hypothetical protein
MKLSRHEDSGQDLTPGQIVWIRGEVDMNPTNGGDVKVRFFARPGFDEYARPSINAIFLRRERTFWPRRLYRALLERLTA